MSHKLQRPARKGPRGGVSTPFPEKLHDILSDDQYCDIISWQPHGRCFVLHKPQEFLQKIMPQHFRQSKLTSFQRQLNLYGFNRITEGLDKGGYYHGLFLRGQRSMCTQMIRVRVKGKDNRASPNQENPDFYNIPPCDCYLGENDLSSINDMDTCKANETPNHLLRGKCSIISVTSSTSFVSSDSVIPLLTQDGPFIPALPSRKVTKRFKSHRSPKLVGVSISIPMSPPVQPEAQSKQLDSLDLDHIPVQDELIMFEGKSFHYIESRCISEKQEVQDVPEKQEVPEKQQGQEILENQDEMNIGRCRSVTFDEDSIYSSLKRDLMNQSLAKNTSIYNLVDNTRFSPENTMTMNPFCSL